MTNNTGVKTDEKKQHFDDIYVEPTPIPYKIRILDALSYVSDDFNREMFDAHIFEWAKSLATTRTVRFVDLCSCFGNTTMATIYGMTYNEIRENWKDEESCRSITASRRFNAKVTGIDISAPALAYGVSAGLYDDVVCSNLNARETGEFVHVESVLAEADILLSTAALVYLDLETIDTLISSFAGGSKTNKNEGYILVNFLNPFSLEKADETKRILLKHLDFVGSRATRHRKMSALEQKNYPGEDWSLLELWVLKRRS